MKRDDILRMARKAGFNTDHNMITVEGWEISPYMQRFAALVEAAERKRISDAASAECGCGLADEVNYLQEQLLQERDRKLEEGWRQCALGQKVTKYCGLAEDAVADARLQCARVCEQTALLEPDHLHRSLAYQCRNAILALADKD